MMLLVSLLILIWLAVLVTCPAVAVHAGTAMLIAVGVLYAMRRAR